MRSSVMFFVGMVAWTHCGQFSLAAGGELYFPSHVTLYVTRLSLQVKYINGNDGAPHAFRENVSIRSGQIELRKINININ